MKYLSINLRLFLLTTFVLLLSTVNIYAAPVSLQLTIDEPQKGRAVLSGSLNELRFANPTQTSFDFLRAGTHWAVHVTIFEVGTGLSAPPLKDFSIAIRANHVSAPHAGEAAPGLTLRGQHGHILGINSALHTIGPQDSFDSLLHPGTSDNHRDTLASHIDNLNNGNGLGFLTNNLQMSVRIDLAHTPEPATLLLFGSSFIGAAGARRFLRKK